MASETCRMCGDFTTPWESVKELNGHVCAACSGVLAQIEAEFEVLLENLSVVILPGANKTIEQTHSPRMIKKGLYAVIRKWCNMHYVKHETDTTVARYNKAIKDE